MSKHHIIKTKRGYLAVVEGGQTKELADKESVAQIKHLLRIRKKAGIELSKLIRDRGCTTANEFQATRTLGE
jgi:hypothetical protein